MRRPVLALVLGLLIQAACNSGSATPAKKEAPAQKAPAAPDLAAAQANYTRLCAACHADDGTGYRADNAP